LGDYTKQFSRQVFKVMNKALPGPFTFILNASNKVPKLFDSNKKTIGIRIPNNNIAREIVQQLGNPIIATSVHDEDEIIEYTTDPELIHEKFERLVDIVIDGGYGNNIASTIVDCTNDDIEVVREGAESIEAFL
jgi:tRNA threonylcarbamoyl adenosine modification protein (Sua5/YciO/YrdC/YwlC family)